MYQPRRFGPDAAALPTTPRRAMAPHLEVTCPVCGTRKGDECPEVHYARDMAVIIATLDAALAELGAAS